MIIGIEQILSFINGNGPISMPQGETTGRSFLAALMACFQNHDFQPPDESAEGIGSVFSSMQCRDEEIISDLQSVFMHGVNPENQDVSGEPGSESPLNTFLNISPNSRDASGFPGISQNNNERLDEVPAGAQPSDSTNINEILVSVVSCSSDMPREGSNHDIPQDILGENRPQLNENIMGRNNFSLGRRTEARLSQSDQGLLIQGEHITDNELEAGDSVLNRTRRTFAPLNETIVESKGFPPDKGDTIQSVPVNSSVTEQDSGLTSAAPSAANAEESRVDFHGERLDREQGMQEGSTKPRLRSFSIKGDENHNAVNNRDNSRGPQSRESSGSISNASGMSEVGQGGMRPADGTGRMESDLLPSKNAEMKNYELKADSGSNESYSKNITANDKAFSETPLESSFGSQLQSRITSETAATKNSGIEATVIEDVQEAMRISTKKREYRMEIQLNPPSLGRLRVDIKVNAEQVNAVFIASDPMVKEILETNVSRLREALLDQGLFMEEFQVHVNSQGGRNSRENTGNYHFQQNNTRISHEGHDPIMTGFPLRIPPVNDDGINVFI